MSTEKSKNVVITKKARENLVKARAGAITLPKIIGMAFGEGGVNSSGTVIAPAESQSRLNKELFRKAIDGYTFPNDTTCRYECTLAESELAGKEISEIGLYDTNGDIVCIKTFTRNRYWQQECGSGSNRTLVYRRERRMSAFNMGEKLCKEYGCLCATCEHRHTSFKKCETSCLCCDPDMPLDSFEYDTEAYGGISKCASYSRKKETK